MVPTPTAVDDQRTPAHLRLLLDTRQAERQNVAQEVHARYPHPSRAGGSYVVMARRPLRLLILGGTGEAARLAARLAGAEDLAVISSLAGRTTRPRLPDGIVRTGGFGGAAGLAAYLRQEHV